MKNINSIFALVIAISSCSMFRSVTSNTTITPQNSFVLGSNEHGPFSVKLKNLSKNQVVLHRVPNNGGNHSYVTVQPNETVIVKVERNTSLVIENKTEDTASIYLNIKGDTGLSMGYKR
ncbi:MAG: hypothetical protein ACKVOM_09650 [Ferruginibacter sp.]